jgi:Ion transport protein
LNLFFTGVFTIEAIIKITSQGKHYFKDNWNIFDFIIVITSIGSVFLTNLSSVSLGGSTTIIRAIRITRIFKFIKSAKKLKLIFNTFIYTIPALANVGGLLLLLLYLYSILGINLYAEIMWNGAIDERLNF